MWFKNATLFQYELGELDASQFNAALKEKALKPCPPHARETVGWMPALMDEMSHEVNGVKLICMGKESRILPRGVITQVLNEKVQQLETQQGRTLKRAEKKQLAEDIEFELLPKSFCVQKKLFILFDQMHHHIIMNTTSPGQVSQAMSLLKKTFAGIKLDPLPYPEQLGRCFAKWIDSPSTLPKNIQLASDCILFSLENEKKRVHYKGYELPADEVTTLLSQGMGTAEISLIWNEKIQFTLTHEFVFKKMKTLDYLVDEFNEITQLDEAYQQADAALTLMAGELRGLRQDMLNHLGVKDELNSSVEIDAVQ